MRKFPKNYNKSFLRAPGFNSRGRLRNENPPSFIPTKRLLSKYRFESSAALTKNSVQQRDFFDLLCMAATTTTAYALCSSARIRGLKIWGPMASDLKPVTVAVEWIAAQGIGSPSMIRSDTSMGSSVGAFVSYAPPEGSQAYLWLDNTSAGTNTLLEITCPANSIIDLVLEQDIINNSQGISPVSAAVAGATVGQVYVRSLNSNGSNNVVPISYPTI